MKKKVGLFGGSFDPVHLGHIHLSLQLFEIYQLDEVLFCPSFCSPFRTKSPPVASGSDRVAMLQLALEQIPHFNITTIEIDRKEISFTIDTIRALQTQDKQYHLLLSDESAAHLDRWKEAQELIRLAPPLIGTRSRGMILPENMVETKVFEVSSSEVRERCGRGLYCGHLVPGKVFDYIKTSGLYSDLKNGSNRTGNNHPLT